MSVRFRVKGFQGLGFRVQGSGFRVQGSGIKVQASGFRVQVLEIMCWNLGYKV